MVTMRHGESTVEVLPCQVQTMKARGWTEAARRPAPVPRAAKEDK